jgi:transposase
MANCLTMATIDTILTLHKSGHSNREIARLTGVHRETVGKYVTARGGENRLNPPTGSEAGSPGPRSACQAHHELIVADRKRGHSTFS